MKKSTLMKDNEDSSDSGEFEDLNISYLNPRSPDNQELNKPMFSQAESNELKRSINSSTEE